MSKRVTNELLGQKIDNLVTVVGEIKDDTKANTEFRLQFKGYAAALISMPGLVGGMVAALVSKFLPRGG